MAGFDDTEALNHLTALAGKSIEPIGFRTALSEVMPGWMGNADPLKGYVNPAQHGFIAAARALYDVIPASPFKPAFQWGTNHGFDPAAGYGESLADAGAVKAFLDAAVAHQQMVVNS